MVRIRKREAIFSCNVVQDIVAVEATDRVIGPPKARENGRVGAHVSVSGIVTAFRRTVIALRINVGDIGAANSASGSRTR
jgi:hypothetical protein